VRRRVPAFACALAISLSCGVALASSNRHVSAHSGTVSATLSYTHAATNAVAPYSHLQLTIVRAARTLVKGPVANRLCGTLCWPQLPGALRVLDVEADGEPDVLLNLYSGGAHCCFVTEIFRYNATAGAYRMLLREWGDPGYSLARLDGSKPYEWLTADDRFAYAFAAFAFSGLPLEILRLDGTKFTDVTSRYPVLVAKDAARQWSAFQSNRSARTGLGFLAAWAADEYTLGRGSAVTATLAQLLHAGELRSLSGWAAAAKFVAGLNRSLRQWGYER